MGAPDGGMHWPGPLPTETWKRESDPSVMPTGSSTTSNSGVSSIRPRPAPIGPAMEMPSRTCLDRSGDRAVLRARAVRIAEEAADAVGGGLLMSGSKAWMMSPMIGASQRPDVNVWLKPVN